MKKSTSIGDMVVVKNKDSIYFREWGTVVDIDMDGYLYVAIANGVDSVPMFDNNEVKLLRKV